jgi:hypothetical protein
MGGIQGVCTSNPRSQATGKKLAFCREKMSSGTVCSLASHARGRWFETTRAHPAKKELHLPLFFAFRVVLERVVFAGISGAFARSEASTTKKSFPPRAYPGAYLEEARATARMASLVGGTHREERPQDGTSGMSRGCRRIRGGEKSWPSVGRIDGRR